MFSVGRYVADEAAFGDNDAVGVIDPVGHAAEGGTGVQVVHHGGGDAQRADADEGDAVVGHVHAGGVAVFVHDDGRFGFRVVECGRLGDAERHAALVRLFGAVGGGNPFAGGADFGQFGGADAAVDLMGFVLGAVTHLHGDFGDFPDVFADPSRFCGVFTVVYPIEHAEVGVFPRGAVDDTAVGGDAAGHDAYPYLLVAVVQVEHGKLVRYAVNPEQRMGEAAVAARFVLGKADPVFAVGRGSLYLRTEPVTGRCFGNEDFARGVDGYLTSVVAVADEEQSLVGDGHCLVEVIERFGEGAEFIDFVRFGVDDGRRVLPRIVRCDGRGESAHVPSARRHDRAHLESFEPAVAGEFAVERKLVHPNLLRSLARFDGYGGIPFGTGAVVVYRDGERPFVRAFDFYPRRAGRGRPLGRGSLDVDGERGVPFAEERTGHLAEVHVVYVVFRLGGAAGDESGRAYGRRNEVE